MSKYYTGIVSRETPPHILELMGELSYFLAHEGWVLRSGGARGADTAFEKGLPHDAPSEIFTKTDVTEKIRKKIEKQGWMPLLNRMGYNRHVDPDIQNLILRDVLEILGPNLDEPSHFLICYTREGRWEGGTRYALAVAHELDIPVHNLGLYEEIVKAHKMCKRIEDKIHAGKSYTNTRRYR